MVRSRSAISSSSVWEKYPVVPVLSVEKLFYNHYIGKNWLHFIFKQIILHGTGILEYRTKLGPYPFRYFFFKIIFTLIIF